MWTGSRSAGVAVPVVTVCGNDAGQPWHPDTSTAIEINTHCSIWTINIRNMAKWEMCLWFPSACSYQLKLCNKLLIQFIAKGNAASIQWIRTSEGKKKPKWIQLFWSEESTRGHSKCIHTVGLLFSQMHSTKNVLNYSYWKVHLEEFLILHSKYC